MLRFQSLGLEATMLARRGPHPARPTEDDGTDVVSFGHRRRRWPLDRFMSSRILVLGATGRLGHVAAECFRDAGWNVVSLVRPGHAKLRATADPDRRGRRVSTTAAVSDAAHRRRCRSACAQSELPALAHAGAAARLFGADRRRAGRRDADLSRQSLQLRFAAAAGDRRNHPDAADVAQGADPGGRSRTACRKPPRNAACA